MVWREEIVLKYRREISEQNRENHDFAPKFDVFAPKISRLILFEFASSVFMNSRLSRVYF